MSESVHLAPCPIYYWAKGGALDPDTWQPLFTAEAIPQYCDRAADCGCCSYLQEAIRRKRQEGWFDSWECTTCLDSGKQSDRESGIDRFVPGYYQAGRVIESNPHKSLPLLENYDNHDDDHPPLPGCACCGYQTSFLHLVLRRRR